VQRATSDLAGNTCLHPGGAVGERECVMLCHRRVTTASGRSLIVPVVDPYDPRERAELMQRYNELTGPVYARCASAAEIERMIRRDKGVSDRDRIAM
jgi:hypothetical protein